MKYVHVAITGPLHDALQAAASRRRMHKAQLVEKLLAVVVADQLIDAVLDDDPLIAAFENGKNQQAS